MGRLILVSNRLPVSIHFQDGRVVVSPSAGGVATGLRGPHERSTGVWIGWPGSVSQLSFRQKFALERALTAARLVPVFQTPEETTLFYDGFSNGVVWPLFHYRLDRIPLDAAGWVAYRRVNARYAEIVARQYRPGDLVWIHDYQLMLVPAMLRARVPDARIGFFLHIPFPAADVFRTLPWRDEILHGLLGADLVGFHAFPYLSHFSRAVLWILGIEHEVDRMKYEDREVRLGVFPMGVDAGAIGATAEQVDVLRDADAVRHQNPGCRMLLGVDRLDYTKGLTRRLVTFERLLKQDPSLVGATRLLQIAVPSRVAVRAYARVRREVDRLVGRINGAYSTLLVPPVHYLYRAVNQLQLAAFYRAAEVMLVTPLRDGMNLVAKEFVAARTDEDGVLVLSEFAGAAAELGEALLVNPYDIDGTARTIARALSMPAAERRTRMRALRQRVLDNDVHRWAESFLSALESAGSSGRRRAPSSGLSPAALSDRLREARPLLLLLDYDGTLVPFASTPEAAAPDQDLLELLAALSTDPAVHVHIVSGRDPVSLDRWLGWLQVRLHAEHGFWFRDIGGAWTPHGDIVTDWKARLRPILDEFARRTPGAWVEEKSVSLVWHYRLADREFGALQARELRAHLASSLNAAPLEAVSGPKIVEVRPVGVNKSLMLSHVAAPEDGFGLVVAIGDDVDDEDLFAALPRDAVAVRVGGASSRAGVHVPDYAAVRRLLQHALEPVGEPA